MFSRVNDIYAYGPLSALYDHPMFHEPVCCLPTKLVRCTNEVYDYFGQYPHTCASISTDSIVERMLGKTALTVKRHVVEIAVDMRIAKQDVVRRINQLICQLEALSDICEWRKLKNVVTVTFAERGEGERVKFECYVCNDTGMFHILACKDCLWNEGGVVYPDMDSDKLNKLIYSIRRVYQDYENCIALPDLTKEAWESTYPMTKEQTTEFVHFEPEWLHDGLEWNFPDIEGDDALLNIGDILERMAFCPWDIEKGLREELEEEGWVFRELEEGEIVEGEVAERLEVQAEPVVFEVEECEEPPYKKRRLE